MEGRIEYINIPVNVINTKNGNTLVTTTKESEKLLGNSIYSQGKTYEEAEKGFWEMLKYVNDYHLTRSNELNKWKWFQKGDWSKTGGSWFTILGINVYFRYGKNMKGGWYIPFTKMNILIHNHWRKHKEDEE